MFRFLVVFATQLTTCSSVAFSGCCAGTKGLTSEVWPHSHSSLSPSFLLPCHACHSTDDLFKHSIQKLPYFQRLEAPFITAISVKMKIVMFTPKEIIFQ